MVRNFRAAVEDWDEVCTALGQWEARNLANAPSPSGKARHSDCLRELITWGELVRQSISHPAFPEPDLTRRVDERLRHLQDKLALWHGEMTVADEERILKAAFP